MPPRSSASVRAHYPYPPFADRRRPGPCRSAPLSDSEEAGIRIAYRPEIDGLRAVAVLQVVLYHACGIPVSGFAGVDVFFVISGYLITLLLLREHAATGRIDLVAFYARRVRRIFPAALFVILVAMAASMALLWSSAQRAAAHAAAAAALFASNVYFQLASGGYWDPASDEQPLLHLWSLAVEEQFYLIWPLLLIVLLRRRSMVVLGSVAAFVSFAGAELLLRYDTSAAFYQMPARFWELAVGGILAASTPRAQAPWLSVVGAACVIAGAFVPIAHFPGAGALPAVAGTVLLLRAVHGPPSSPEAMAWARFAPLQFVGRISYSLYLWHWPLLALYDATTVGRGDTATRLVLAVVAVALAAATYRYLEQPVRHRRADARLLGAGVAASLAVAAIAIVGALSIRQSAPPTAREQWAQRVEADLPPHWRRCHYSVSSVDFPRPDCASRPGTAPTVAIWGDSMALSWKPLAWTLAERLDASAIGYTRDACAPLVGYLAPSAMPADIKCRDFNDRVAERLDDLSVLILALRLDDEGAATKIAQLRATLDLASPRVGRILVLGPTPRLRDPVPKCIRRGDLDACAVTRAQFDEVAGPHRAALRALAARYPNVALADPSGFFCDEQRCPATRGDLALYRDDYHVTATAAAAFARTLEAAAPH
jgi:peptidoglycan/LPS O-acetylase OafA/YrhL